jgi:hypothetical protein
MARGHVLITHCDIGPDRERTTPFKPAKIVKTLKKNSHKMTKNKQIVKKKDKNFKMARNSQK